MELTMADLTVHRFQAEVPKALTDFDPKDFVEQAMEWVRETVAADETVALSTSGGVDSTTVAFLLKEALGERLHLFFIDDGLRRIMDGREESEVTADMFKGFPDFQVLPTRSLVLPWFEGIADGTLKRDMFRNLYTLTSNKHIASIGAHWIADGTIAPDIVMTEEKRQIQHNVNLPYNMKKLEPLVSLYKPQVRKVAMFLGAPRDFAMRIPCPGPAQLLRVGGAFSEEKLEVCKRATDTVEQSVRAYCREKWGEICRYDETTGVRTPFQYFATSLGPEMELDSDLTRCVSDRLGHKLKCHRMKTEAMWIDTSVSEQEKRLYAPIVWVQGPPIAYDAFETLMNAVQENANLPRVLYEIFGKDSGTYPVGVKILESEDVRTAWPMDIDFDSLSRLGQKICEDSRVSRVGFDISKRPPATIELF